MNVTVKASINWSVSLKVGGGESGSPCSRRYLTDGRGFFSRSFISIVDGGFSSSCSLGNSAFAIVCNLYLLWSTNLELVENRERKDWTRLGQVINNFCMYFCDYLCCVVPCFSEFQKMAFNQSNGWQRALSTPKSEYCSTHCLPDK